MAATTRADPNLWLLAELGYHAVGDGMGWRRKSGAPLPQWREQTEAVRNAVYDAQAAAQTAISLLE